MPDSGNAMPHFPPIFHDARVGGEVLLRAAIDSTGRLDPDSLQVVSTTHDLFTSAARRAAREWRFAPARRDGRAVAVRYDLHFTFAQPEADSTPRRPVQRAVATASALRITVGWEPEPRQSSISLGAADLLAAQMSAIRAVLPRVPADSGRATCIGLLLGTEAVDPEPAVLADLPRRPGGLVAGSDCPPTYESWILQVDSAGRPLPERRPPGALDPWSLDVTRVVPWQDALVLVDITTGRGRGGDLHRCEARRTGGSWRARCERRGSWVS